MFRDRLGPQDAMLFVFPAPAQQSFWMKNVPIELDMIFIREDYSVLGVVHRAQPHTTSSRWVPGKSQYVLEIAGGRAKELGIRNGQWVRFIVAAVDF